MADLPPIRCAPSGEVNIAYRTFGDGDDVIMTPAATVTMDVC